MASGGPSWQIDIPSLSQLVFSAGAYGLKQLALAGVDPHTIGCMMMISEYTPASQEFRGTLCRAREQQRADRVWIYRVIEVGASTNFLADQMLKTRAGENVIALLSATVSVMDEKACISTLSALFDAAGVSLDNIPGMVQLQNIRTSLASLARKTGFREKVLHYHYFLSSIIQPQQGARVINSTPYDAIPATSEIPAIIKVLHKMVTVEGSHVLIFKGIRGAAWTAAYASYILGLETCAVNRESAPVPITSDYDSARVVFDLSSTETKCELFREGNILDFITFNGDLPPLNSGWSIDCSLVDFFDLHHPGLKRETPLGYLRLSNFAAIEAMNTVSSLIGSFETQDTDSMAYRTRYPGSAGFISFTQMALPHLHRRAMRILAILGLRPAVRGFRFKGEGECPNFHCIGHETDPEPIWEETDIEQFNYKTGKREKKKNLSRSGQYLEPGSIQFVQDEARERLKYYLDDQTRPEMQKVRSWPTYLLSEIARTVNVAVQFAAKLAFTDWDKSLRIMSARTVSSREIPQLSSHGSNFEGHMAEAIALCSDSMPVDALEGRLWSVDWLGLDIDGIIVLRNAALSYSLMDMDGVFLSFQRGRILYEESNYHKIRSDRVGTLSHNMSLNHGYGSQSLGAQDKSLNIRARSLVSPIGDTIFVRLEATLNSSTAIVADCSLAAQLMTDFLVTMPCEHGYLGDKLLIPRDAGFVSVINEGLFFDDQYLAGTRRGNESGAIIFYQQTSKNSFGQWLASQWQPHSSDGRGLRVIQKDCCINCLVARLEVVYNWISDSYKALLKDYPICVIAGMREDSKDQTRR
ncbi:hypothetical protein BDV25DRAFT_156073 [Aspergillus avenaceus]|uniref:Uncharacterized protein n=1 Tax=Aspergillus avenaceus TaxID=36643 RepID=A0A5N6TTF3_ASPAV|nr:hypothetical protein BDV25DRAFT_156073 [Aspergillus avenaceus]